MPTSHLDPRLRVPTRLLLAFSALCGAAAAQATGPAPLPALKVPPYMGTWYQMALFPNFFQKQCVSDTTATYRQLEGGQVEVTNRCRRADGSFESVVGVARPDGSRLEGDTLKPATLEVSFMPAWLRWLPFWGSYWVLAQAEDGRYAVVGESRREYLWVLTREPRLAATDETAIRSLLQKQGYDLSRWQAHPHGASASSPEKPR